MRMGSDGDAAAGRPPVEADGIVEPQGITSYQYGSHVLIDETGVTRYALRSDDPVMLDEVTGRHVRVHGDMVPGYPVDMGPPLIDVKQVDDA